MLLIYLNFFFISFFIRNLNKNHILINTFHYLFQFIYFTKLLISYLLFLCTVQARHMKHLLNNDNDYNDNFVIYNTTFLLRSYTQVVRKTNDSSVSIKFKHDIFQNVPYEMVTNMRKVCSSEFHKKGTQETFLFKCNQQNIYLKKQISRKLRKELENNISFTVQFQSRQLSLCTENDFSTLIHAKLELIKLSYRVDCQNRMDTAQIQCSLSYADRNIWKNVKEYKLINNKSKMANLSKLTNLYTVKNE